MLPARKVSVIQHRCYVTLSSFVGVLRVGVKNRRHVKWILIIKELGAG